MALLTGQLVKDKYFYLPQMGMYWDIYAIKRISGEDEAGFNERIDELNEALGKAAGKGQEWFVCLFLLPSQIYAFPTKMQSSLAAKCYLMVADPSFKENNMPAHGPWNPVDFVWVSNKVVKVWEYKDSPEHTAEWLSRRFKVIQENEVKAAPTPANSYNPWATTPPVTPPPDDEPDDGSPTLPMSGDLTMHMVCPHCGKKIF